MSVCESVGETRLRYDECVRECWIYWSDLSSAQPAIHIHCTVQEELYVTIISFYNPITRVFFTVLFLCMHIHCCVNVRKLRAGQSVFSCADTVVPIYNLTARCLLAVSW